jgi:hypothetical protein
MNNPIKLDSHFEPITLTQLFYVLAFCTAVMIGALISMGNPIPLIMGLGGLVSLFLLFQPLLLLWVVTFSTLIFAGIVAYHFPSLNKLWWAGYILSAMLYVSALLHSLFLRNSDKKRRSSSHLGYPILGLVGISLLSTIVNKAPAWQVVLAIKSMFLYGGVWAALALIKFTPTQIKQWLLGLLGIGLVQALPVAYQFVFVRSARIASGLGAQAETADSVVGTFGGSMEGGGYGAVLGLYACILFVGLFAFQRAGLIKRFDLFWMLGLLVPPLLLTEVKAVFIYLPIGFAFLYRDVLKTRPLAFVSGALLVLSFGMILLIGYQLIHWSGDKGESFTDNVTHYFGYSFGDKFEGKEATVYGRMTRREVLEFWWDKHGTDEILTTLIGHGLGASRTSGLDTGHIAKKYAPLQIDLSALSTLLWDVGVIGVLAVLMTLFLGYVQAGRLAGSLQLEAWQRAVAACLQIMFVWTAINLGYDRSVTTAAPMTFILMVSLGLVEWLNRQRKEIAI